MYITWTKSPSTSSRNFVLAREVLGEHAAILPYPLQVGAGLRIARLGQLRHAEDDQLAALQGEHPLAGANPHDKLLHGEGLVDEVVGAGVHAVDDELRALPRGEQDDVDVTAGETARRISRQSSIPLIFGITQSEITRRNCPLRTRSRASSPS